jgi:sugar lactone lactonase YvrE
MWTYGAILILMMMVTLNAHAQASYAGAQDTIISPGEVNEPTDVATDGSGNVYIINGNYSSILKYTKSNSTWSSTTVATFSSMPTATTGSNQYTSLSVDTAGNVYAAYQNVQAEVGGVLKFTLNSDGSYTSSTLYAATGGTMIPTVVRVDAANNVLMLTTTIASCGSGCISSTRNDTVTAISATGTTSTVYTGLLYMASLALDSSRNIFFVSGTTVYEVPYTSGAYATTPTTLYNMSNVGNLMVEGIAVDSADNVFVAVYDWSTTYSNVAFELVNNSGTYTATQVASSTESYAASDSIAVDFNGAVYFFCDSLIKHTFGAIDAGTVSVGSNTALPALTFSFANSATISSINVLTDGLSGLDFGNAGTGTCAANSTAVSSCTVGVQFAPTAAGLRRGAVQIVDSTGATATAYVYGIGSAPQVVFQPGTQSSIGRSWSAPMSPAVDASGNVYVLDGNAGTVVKESLSGGTYNASTLASSIATNSFGITLDGAGNIFVAQTMSENVLKITPSGTQTTLGSGLGRTFAVAADGAGNVYVADPQNSRIVKLTPSSSGYTQSTVLSMGSPFGVAVDSSGNLYVSNASYVYKETLSNGAYTQSTVGDSSSGLSNPTQLAVDAAGNVYVVDQGGNTAFKFTLTSSGYSVSTLASGLKGPSGIAVDGSGNVYIADTGDELVLKQDYADGPVLSFGNVALHGEGSQTATVQNVGNATLTFPVTTPTLSSGYSLDSSSTCSQYLSSGLTSAASCTLVVDFNPTAVGSNNGTLTLTDTNLNAASPNYSAQQITLSGSGIAETVPTKFVVSMTSPFTAGTLGTVTVTAEDASGYTVTGYTGTVHFTSSDSLAVLPGDYTFTSTDAGAHSFSAELFAAGSQSITATDTATSTETGTGTVTVDAATAASIAISAGGTQSAVVNAQFTKALTVLVTDAYGNPVSGALVTYAAPGSGASATLSSTTATTGITGVASVTATANGTAGSYSVGASITATVSSVRRATSASSTSASFSLTNNAVTFTVTSPGTISLTQGGTGTAKFTLSGSGTPSGTVTLACSGLPSGLSCQVSPSTISASQLPAAVTVTITSSAITSSTQARVRGMMTSGWQLALLLPGMFMLPLGLRKRKVTAALLGTLLALTMMFCLSSCGSSSHQSYTTSGTYTAVVTATASGATTSTTNITVDLAAK